MFDTLVLATGALLAISVLAMFVKYQDSFHPAMILLPMCAFMYVWMPTALSKDGALWSYMSEAQGIWAQQIVLGAMVLLVGGLIHGSSANVTSPKPIHYDREVLHKGAYIIGGLGVAAWGYAIRNSGGITAVFSEAKGYGWSDWGFIREAAYLMIVGLLLLMSPQGFAPKDKKWRIAVVVFSIPYLIQGLLGAQRGPTFLILVTLGMSWYLGRGKRPSLVTLCAAGVGIGMLLLLLVANRGAIYLGSQQKLTMDASGYFDATEANEYIFGTGCMVAASQTDRFFWGKRYLAQIVVRPIPHQLWPNKYEDFGVPELLTNAGVAGDGLTGVMGWSEIPGAAAAMVGDLWVEFSWLTFPVMWIIGYWYGSTWKKAVVISGPWATQYMVLALLSIYMVSQSGEAVIFRFFILTLPSWYVWKKAAIAAPQRSLAAA